MYAVIFAIEGMENLWAQLIFIGNLVLSHPDYGAYIS